VDTPVLSVVIPCRNAEEYLDVQLRALAAQDADFEWEVVFVDNGSSDRSATIAAAYKPQLPITIVDASDRPGQAYARNVGAQVARADRLLFIDADDEVAPGFLAAFHEALSRRDFVTCPSEDATLNPAWTRHAHDLTQATHGAWPPFAGGTAFGASRAALDTVGRWPEEFTPVEDIALSILLQRSAFELHRLPTPLLRYRHRTTILGLHRQTRAWGYGQTLVFREFGPDVVPPRALRLAVSEWLTAARKLVGARSKADLAQVAVRFGYCIGRLQGSIRHRTLFL